MMKWNVCHFIFNCSNEHSQQKLYFLLFQAHFSFIYLTSFQFLLDMAEKMNASGSDHFSFVRISKVQILFMLSEMAL